MSSKVPMVGRRFGRLVVIKEAAPRGSDLRWHCHCDCGIGKDVSGAHMRRGHVKSCGCLNKDVLRARVTKHGACRTPEYISWSAAKSRCVNPQNDAYQKYGGRGIRMCPRWLDSFENFLADMGPRPSPQHSIDRINNDGNYEPGNCRWAVATQQNNNKSNVRLFTLRGKTKTTTEWAADIGITDDALRRRIDKLGWSLERALMTPNRGRNV